MIGRARSRNSNSTKPAAEAYKVERMPIRQAGGVVVKRVGSSVRFLLVSAKSDPKAWVLPKGHIEEDETAEAAAIREVREEAGVVARVRSSLGHVTFKLRGNKRDVEFFLMDYVKDVPPEEDRKV